MKLQNDGLTGSLYKKWGTHMIVKVQNRILGDTVFRMQIALFLE